MQQILPLVTVCATLLAVCLAYLTYVFVRHFKKARRNKTEQYVYEDDEVLTVDLSQLKRKS